MFQLDDIKKAHAKVKSGADFPSYVLDLIHLGVKRYDSYVSDGHTQFFGDWNFQVQSEAKYAALNVSERGDSIQFQHYLKIHQQGQTDYPTFCRHAAETGVEKWTVDLDAKTCTYFDKAKNRLVEEKIPVP